MTPPPDPVRASFEAWWRDTYPLHPLLIGSHHAYAEGFAQNAAFAAYCAASKVSELERAVVEAAMEAWEYTLSKDIDMLAHGMVGRDLSDKCAALRLHRTPPKADRVVEALKSVEKAQALSRTDSDQEQYLDEARDLLTAELEARSNA